MREGGRVAGAIEIVELVLERHQPAKDALRDWGKAHRFAGSGDRAWMSGLVLDALRRRASLRYLMSEDTPRALVIGALRWAWGLSADEIAAICDGSEHAPEPLSAAERGALLRELDETAPLHVRAEIPDWLEASFSRGFGVDAVKEGAGMAGRAPVDLRVNTAKTEPEKAFSTVVARIPAAIPSSLVLDAIRIPETDPKAKSPPADSIPAYGKGWVEVQDLGSQIAALAAGPIEGCQVLDYCAGAGGKTLALSALMNNTGQVHAWDYDWRRLRAIWPRLKRADAHNVQVHDGDESVLAELEGRMDVVFIDAPCTGSGTWRRRPDSKWRLKSGALNQRIKEQDDVLVNAAKYVKPGGHLVYVTCSVLPDENEDRIAHFLEGRADFNPVDPVDRMKATGRLTDEGEIMIAACGGRFRALQLTPARVDTDGFYICVMERI